MAGFFGRVVILAATSGALACGGGGSGPKAKVEVLDFKITSPQAGAAFIPGNEITYELNYRGSLADPPRITAVLTHETTGAVSKRILAVNETQQDSTFIIKQKWIVRDDFFKKAGAFHLALEASIQPTLRGSDPWLVETAPLPLTVDTKLDAIRLVVPAGAGPIAYGTPMEIQVDGHDLWDDVVVTAVDAAGVAVPELQTAVPFTAGVATLRHPWTISARALESVGSHGVRLVATFGELNAQSDPLTLVLTHTIDDVMILVRDQTDVLLPSSGSAEVRLPAVKELVARARGTLLAGHEVTVNGGTPFVAGADSVETTRVPATGDFAAGKGSNTYAFTFRSGGVERTGTIVLTRWGIESCGWFSADGGQPLPNQSLVQPGTVVVMKAMTWGFPDTKTTLGIFKDRQATFQIWESDSGRHILLGPGDDDVDNFDADITANLAQHSWTAAFVEGFGPPGFDKLGLPVPVVHSELFFNVKIEDQSCTSLEMRVPSGKAKPDGG